MKQKKGYPMKTGNRFRLISLGMLVILVCVFCLAGCANIQDDNKQTTEEEQWDLIPMVMVDGVLYLDTGHTNSEIRKCGTFEGEITSEVDGSERPTKDDQSNFGTGYGYQYGATEGTIELYMNDKWRIFATEEVRQQIQRRKIKRMLRRRSKHRKYRMTIMRWSLRSLL